jgi:Ser/Thr protein kinase RdoA (MazF antagonist)
MNAQDPQSIGNTGICPKKLQGALSLWPELGDARYELINHTENATFKLTLSDGTRKILRVHRPGYNSVAAINSELQWAMALRRETELLTPIPLAGQNGSYVQNAAVSAIGDVVSNMVLFEFEEGREPQEQEDLSAAFETLGRMAAIAHQHAKDWQKPEGFERLVWRADRILDEDGLWGDWRKSPGMTPEYYSIFEQLDQTLRKRLASYGTDQERFGLIHADMRLANLLVDGDQIKLIDFDDCGFCWYMYDFAAAISFFEDSPQVPALKEAWTKGYRHIAPLDEIDIAELDSFIMLRRMALTAWIGSHAETPFAASLADHFVPTGAKLAQNYLEKFG